MTGAYATVLTNPVVAFAMAGFSLIYFVPALVALVRLSDDRITAVVVLDIVLGWTVVGWILAMVLAVRGPRMEPDQGSEAGVTEVNIPMVIVSPHVVGQMTTSQGSDVSTFIGLSS